MRKDELRAIVLIKCTLAAYKDVFTSPYDRFWFARGYISCIRAFLERADVTPEYEAEEKALIAELESLLP